MRPTTALTAATPIGSSRRQSRRRRRSDHSYSSTSARRRRSRSPIGIDIRERVGVARRKPGDLGAAGGGGTGKRHRRSGHGRAAAGQHRLEVGRHLGGGSVTVLPRLAHRLEHDSIRLDRQRRHEPTRGHDLVGEVLGENAHRRGRLERRLAGEHAIKRRAQAVQVGPRIERLTAHLFRRHVIGRAQHLGARAGRRAFLTLAQLRQAEIENLRVLDPVPAGHSHEVFRLEIAMNDPCLVSFGQPGAHLNE